MRSLRRIPFTYVRARSYNNRVLYAQRPNQMNLDPGQFRSPDGTLYEFATRNPCCLRNKGCGAFLRRGVAAFVTWKPFDNVILFLILLNSLMIACTDYTVIDLTTMEAVPTGTSTAAPYPSNSVSLFNTANFYAGYGFTVAFTLECVLKIFAMGFLPSCYTPPVDAEAKAKPSRPGDPIHVGSYLSDGWNRLDFFVVVTSFLAQLPFVPNVTMFRTLRVLRPLRSLNAIPRLKGLVGAMISSVPQILNATVVILFMFVVFGILMLQLYSGKSNFRCRYTPFPVHLNGHSDAWQVVEDERAYRISGTASSLLIGLITNRTAHPYCGVLEHGGMFSSIFRDSTSNALKLFDPLWSKSNSPWAVPHDCVWPVVPTDTRLCNDGTPFMSTWGQPTYQCFQAPASDAISPGVASYCGSNFDFRGNERFIDSHVMRSPTWGAEWMWGYRTFDSMFESMLTIFQCITTENWAHIMYLFSDSSGAIVTPLIFCLLLLFGAYFVLNLILAVLGDNFDEMMIRELEVIDLANARKKILVEVLRVRRRLHIMAKTQKKKRRMRLARQFHADTHRMAALHSYNARHSMAFSGAQVANPMVNPFDAEVDVYPEPSGRPDAEGGSSSGEEDAPVRPALAAGGSAVASDATAGAAVSSSADEVSVLLCTVIFYANHAHNLTRSP